MSIVLVHRRWRDTFASYGGHPSPEPERRVVRL